MFKVYYNPENNEIKGYSTEGNVMNFPFIETDREPFLLWNYKIEDGKVKPIKMQFTQEEWDLIIKNGKL